MFLTKSISAFGYSRLSAEIVILRRFYTTVMYVYKNPLFLMIAKASVDEMITTWEMSLNSVAKSR